MALSIKHINADTTFLLTFSPPFAGDQPSDSVPGSFTVLIDPWLSGPSCVYNARFAKSEHVIEPCIKSLAELPSPDLVLISQDKPDHCHRETLTQLSKDADAIIVGTSAATRKIKSWKHFDPCMITSLESYNPNDERTIFRFEIPSFSESGAPGEVTLSLLEPRFDLTGVHNAIGITYRPPSSVLSKRSASLLNLPAFPSTSTVTTSSGRRLSCPGLLSAAAMPSTLGGFREKTISVIYSPHGVDYDTWVKPYAENHLVKQGALPLTALIHSFDRCYNPWYLGGNVCAGMQGGMKIAYNLCPRVWVSAHDEDKLKSGISVQQLKIEKNSAETVKEKLYSFDSGVGGLEEKKKSVKFATVGDPKFLSLSAGESYVCAPVE